MENFEKQKTIVLFSGGKDSLYALYSAVSLGYDPILLTFVNENDQLQFTDAVELEREILNQYIDLLPFISIIESSDSENLNSNVVKKVKELIAAYDVASIFTGDLDHIGGIEHVLRDSFVIKVYTPAGNFYKKNGAVSYIEELLKIGCEMIVTAKRSDVSDLLEIGKKLNVEYATHLFNQGVDPTGEDGEFQTLVTKFPFFIKDITLEYQGTLLEKGRDKHDYVYERMDNMKLNSS